MFNMEYRVAIGIESNVRLIYLFIYLFVYLFVCLFVYYLSLFISGIYSPFSKM